MAEKLTSNFFGCVNPCNIEWQKFLTDQVKLDKGNVIEKWFLNDMGECDECKIKFSLFKRKKHCCQCGLAYCSSCLLRNNVGQRHCNKCTILSHWPINLDEISSLRVRDLRFFLNAHKIKTDTIREKRDLIELVVHQLNLRHYGHYQSSSAPECPSGSSNNSSAPEGSSSGTSNTSSAPLNTDDGIRVRPLNSSQAYQSEEHLANSASALPDDNELEGIRVFASSQSPNVVEVTETTPQDSSDNSSSSGWSLLLGELGPDRSPSDSFSHSPNLENLSHRFTLDSESDPCGSQDNTSDNNPSDAQVQETEESVPPEQAEPPPLPPPNQASSSIASNNMTLATDVVKLSSIETEENIKELSVRQCKEILALHRVDYSGVWEKHELVSKVKMLWKDYQLRQEEKNVGDEQLCKICMDAVMDCVLLECGHIVSCTECGKQMSECPICRQNVIRVVKTFRA